MPRWVSLIIAVILGIALGLFYGWVISPVQFVDTTPASLREDYRTDYVLMIAEAYQADRNADLATRRLAIFGSDSPAATASRALRYAEQVSYSSNDISLLQGLTKAMQAYQPAPTFIGGTP